MTTHALMGVGVLGASGYAGAELVRLLSQHPNACVRAIGSRQFKGETFDRVFPAFAGLSIQFDDDATDPQAWLDKGVRVVFAALPHGAFADRARAFLAAGLRVIDLSADFRLLDPTEYPRRYALEHPAPDLLSQALYALTEWSDATQLRQAQLVANPGCYPTASLLATLPAVHAGRWSGAPIVINAISGVTGAGRGAKLNTHFVECGSSIAPYKVGEAHAHLGEMAQAVARAGGDGTAHRAMPLIFNPHLAPMARGISATVSIPLNDTMTQDEAVALYATRYAKTPFVRVLTDADALPETRHVRGSNRCDLAVRVVAGGRMLLVFSVIDNLLKGAAGQAVQNWNVMEGWPETTGLSVHAWPFA